MGFSRLKSDRAFSPDGSLFYNRLQGLEKVLISPPPIYRPGMGRGTENGATGCRVCVEFGDPVEFTLGGVSPLALGTVLGTPCGMGTERRVGVSCPNGWVVVGVEGWVIVP